MSSDLFVGRLDEFTAATVSNIARGFGIADMTWQSCPEDIAMISVLNDASLNIFIQYAARLEGIIGANALNKTELRNLPWWLNSVWLPIAFDPPRELVSDEGDPMFVGSCHRLLSELAEIQKTSDLGLGNVPREYAAMRQDYRAWWKKQLDCPTDVDDTLSEPDTIRWVWRALRDGAEVALRSNAPMWLAG